jgi:hypothetical protein
MLMETCASLPLWIFTLDKSCFQIIPDFAALHPGYACFLQLCEIRSMCHEPGAHFLQQAVGLADTFQLRLIRDVGLELSDAQQIV